METAVTGEANVILFVWTLEENKVPFHSEIFIKENGGPPTREVHRKEPRVFVDWKPFLAMMDFLSDLPIFHCREWSATCSRLLQLSPRGLCHHRGVRRVVLLRVIRVYSDTIDL